MNMSNTSNFKTLIKLNNRTEGDGMENIPNQDMSIPFKKNIFDVKLLNFTAKQPSALFDKSTENLIQLVPKYIPKSSKNLKYLTKSKEPTFVPYEPYKAAVLPIVPRKAQHRKHNMSKNNIDISDLVIQMSEIATAELNKAKKNAIQNDEILITRKQWEEEKLKYETDIKNLRETNAHLENQLKFQAQVNSELKTLLVAAVGEDLESRVQHLTEDKLALARELLNSANHLTTHREHTEWLSGQCEVWRSKFLASSLMVEELARWKSALTNVIAEHDEILKEIMDERKHIRELVLQTFNNLCKIAEHYPDKKRNKINIKSKNMNIVDLTDSNYKLSAYLENILLKDLPEPRRHKILDKWAEDTLTPVESAALNIMHSPIDISDKPDTICNAVLGATLQIGKGQLFLQHPTDSASCCSECKRES